MGEAVNIARVVDGVVVNVEVAGPEWVAANDGVDGVRFVPYTDDAPAHIGLGWDEATGFAQPEPAEAPALDLTAPDDEVAGA